MDARHSIIHFPLIFYFTYEPINSKIWHVPPQGAGSRELHIYMCFILIIIIIAIKITFSTLKFRVKKWHSWLTVSANRNVSDFYYFQLRERRMRDELRPWPSAYSCRDFASSVPEVYSEYRGKGHLGGTHTEGDGDPQSTDIGWLSWIDIFFLSILMGYCVSAL